MASTALSSPASAEDETPDGNARGQNLEGPGPSTAKPGPTLRATRRSAQAWLVEQSQKVETIEAISLALDNCLAGLKGRPYNLARSALPRVIQALEDEFFGQQGRSTPPSPIVVGTNPDDSDNALKPSTVTSPSAAAGKQLGSARKAPSYAAAAAGPGGRNLAGRKRKPKRDPPPPRDPPKVDPRVFLRLPAGAVAREKGPYALRSFLHTQVPGGVKAVKAVPSGYCIIANTKEGRSWLLSRSAVEHQQLGGQLEESKGRVHYLIDRVPTIISTFDGERLPTTDVLIREEIKYATNQDPISFWWSRHSSDGPERALVVALEKAAKPFHLFGTSARSRELKKKVRVIQCQRCWRFHDARACRSQQTCVTCGETGSHDKCLPRCSNCHAPHRADTPACPARPSVIRGAIKKVPRDILADIRRAGRKATESARRAAGVPQPASSENPQATRLGSSTPLSN